MAEEFDPYYTWLGIRPEEQPPDLYRLIGLRQFEDNADVIANAADRQMQFLRSMQVGKRSAQSQALLNEISAAGGCLLDPQRKAKYDQELRAKEAAKAQAAKAAAAKARPLPKAAPLSPAPKTIPAPIPQPLPQNDPFAMQLPSGPAMPAYSAPLVGLKKLEPPQRLNPALLAAAGGVMVIVVILALVGWMLSRGDEKNTALSTPVTKTPTAAPPPAEVAASDPTATALTPKLETPKTGVEKQPVKLPKELPPTTSPVRPTETAAAETTAPAISDAKLPHEHTSEAKARFIRVEIPGKERVLHLAEVQVFSGDENAAVKGKATQSSVQYEGSANLANDGNTDGNFFEDKTVSHTRVEDNPWWEVDLGTEKPLEKIVLWNRTDEDYETRLQGYKLLALDAARRVVWEISPSDIPKPSSEFVLSGVKQPSVPVVKSGPALPTPVHSWSFDEKSGDTVADSGKGDAKGKNPVHLDRWREGQPRFVPGRIGNALRFTQPEHYAAAERFVNYHSLTVAFWIKVLGEDGINPRIAHPWVELNYEHRAGVGVLGVIIEPSQPEVGKWYHYVVAINQTSRQVTIYRDGEEVVRGTLGVYESRQLVKYWVLGHNQDPGNPNDSFHGELDELKIYDRILTAAEVKQLATTELAQSLTPTGSIASGSPKAPPAATVKVPVPDAAAQEAAQSKVAAIFAAELKGAKTPAQKQSLAKSLLEVAETTTDLGERYALLTEARRLAVEAKDVALASLALDSLGNAFEIGLLAEKVKMLQGIAAGSPTPAQRTAALTAVCAAGHEALDADNLESVNALVLLARSLGAKAPPEGKAEAKEFTDLAGQRQKRMEALRKAEQTLVTAPDNPAANLLVGLHTFFIRGKEQEGLAMLAKGSDPKIAAAAKARGDNVAQGVASSFAEANAWYEAIATANPDYKAHIQRQALAGFTFLASTTTGLDKAKAGTRRDQLTKDVAASPDPAVKRQRMQDFPESTPGLVGRVFVDGKDAGLLLTHRPPGEMKEKALAHILTLTKSSGVRLVLVGTINCPTPCVCHVFQTGKTRGPAQVVAIDGKPVSAVGGTYGRSSDERIPLTAGNHVVQWTIDTDGSNAPRIDLYLNPGDGAKPVAPHVTRAQAFEARKLPVTKEVDVSAYGPDPE